MNNIITKIEVQKKNKDRVNIFVDDSYQLSCSAALVYKHNLKKGIKINIELLQEIIDADNYIKCKNTALKFIEKSYKSENKIVEKLKQVDYNDKTIQKTIEFLKEYDFINDLRYIKSIIKGKMNSVSKKKLAYMLIKKGFDREQVYEALQIITESIEEKSCLKQGRKKYELLIKTEVNKKKISERLIKYLSSNGYNYDTIKNAISSLVDLEISNEGANFNDNFDENKDGHIKEIALKRYLVLTRMEEDKNKIYRKLANYLLRRGYSHESINRVLSDVIKQV